MKIRTQHVSNSSTSSYIVIGFSPESVEYTEEYDQWKERVAEDPLCDFVVKDPHANIANSLSTLGMITKDTWSRDLKMATELGMEVGMILDSWSMTHSTQTEGKYMRHAVYPLDKNIKNIKQDFAAHGIKISEDARASLFTFTPQV